MNGRSIFDGDSWFQFVFANELPVCGPTIDLAVVMRAAASRQKSQAIQRAEPVGMRIGQPLLEPADGPRTPAGQHRSGAPRVAENFGHSPGAPDAQHAL